jgi:hypothetical protein
MQESLTLAIRTKQTCLIEGSPQNVTENSARSTYTKYFVLIQKMNDLLGCDKLLLTQVGLKAFNSALV